MKIYNEISIQDHLNILIIDSGLGGLSVHGLLDKRLKGQYPKKPINLIFFNAVVHHDRGYNTMKDYDEKIRTFDSALKSVMKFNPHLILIACNTLSVIYNETNFSKENIIPVIGIVESAIKLAEEIDDKINSNVIIYGTETTINSNIHKKKLILSGFSPEQIITQKCKDLESEIQLNPESKIVEEMIYGYVMEAKNSVSQQEEKINALLCCTHYGFSELFFKKVHNEIFGEQTEIFNPNLQMVEFALNQIEFDSESDFKVNNYVVSKVDIRESESKNLSKILYEDSPALSSALKKYYHDPILF